MTLILYFHQGITTRPTYPNTSFTNYIQTTIHARKYQIYISTSQDWADSSLQLSYKRKKGMVPKRWCMQSTINSRKHDFG